MKASFVVLAHEHPEHIKSLITCLLKTGSDVYLHYDKNAPHSIEEHIAKWGLSSFQGKLSLAQRVRVKWGEWSIVQATLNCLDLALQHNNSDYLILISGSCMPVKPIALFNSFLELSGKDFIEIVNANKKRWVTDGIQKKRWEHYHYFNWRTQPRRFALSIKLQNKLRIKRALPDNHTPYMGSQWWCLRMSTARKIMEFIDRNPSALAFYRRTWVPDEFFFQTLVANLVPKNEIVPTPLTRYRFNSWGIPKVYYEDQYAELILIEKKYFARKISHRAKILKEKLSSVATMSLDDYKSHLSKIAKIHGETVLDNYKTQTTINMNAWYNLASSNDNIYDYIHSIPNQIIFIVSEDEKIRKSCVEFFANHNDFVTASDFLIGYQSKARTNKQTLCLNSIYDFNSTKIRYKWHLAIGQIAFRNPGKKILITAGGELLKIVDFIKWKFNCILLLVTGSNTDSISPLHSQLLNELLLSNCHTVQCSVKAMKHQFSSSAAHSSARSIVSFRNKTDQNSIFHWQDYVFKAESKENNHDLLVFDSTANMWRTTGIRFRNI